MTKRLIPLLLMTLLLESCGPAVLPPPRTAIVTQTIVPSETPRPTQTAIPTATPYPSLQTEGPYLLFTYDNRNFIIMDADGSGRKQFHLPNDGYVWDLEKAVSPDGKWLAYYTGSADEPYNFALNLLNLEDEAGFQIASLIAPGFPENLEPVTKTIEFIEYDTDCSNDPKCQLSIVESAFMEGIRVLDWSPDGQSLAFVAQVDGPSSDIYVFSMKEQSIYRLTDALENIAQIDWAPNGEKILYLNSVPGRVYTAYYIYVADPKNKSPQHPKAIDGGKFWSWEGWMNDNAYLISSGGEGAPPAFFRYINTDTLQTKVIWNPESEIFTIHSELHALLITLTSEEAELYQTQLKSGTYVAYVDGRKIKISDEIYEPLSEPAFPDSFFAKGDGNLYNVKLNNFTVMLIKENADFTHLPRISPNRKWFIIGDHDKLQLYSEGLELIKSWNIYPWGITWEPNSTGVFLYDYGENMLYYLSIPNTS